MESLSQIVFRIRPWEHDQEMQPLIDIIRNIRNNDIIWGAYNVESVGFGISEIVIAAVINDNNISIDNIVDEFIALDDIISRVDVSMWNKVK